MYLGINEHARNTVVNINDEYIDQAHQRCILSLMLDKWYHLKNAYYIIMRTVWLSLLQISEKVRVLSFFARFPLQFHEVCVNLQFKHNGMYFLLSNRFIYSIAFSKFIWYARNCYLDVYFSARSTNYKNDYVVGLSRISFAVMVSKFCNRFNDFVCHYKSSLTRMLSEIICWHWR
jgi:hypothetical protein